MSALIVSNVAVKALVCSRSDHRMRIRAIALPTVSPVRRIFRSHHRRCAVWDASCKRRFDLGSSSSSITASKKIGGDGCAIADLNIDFFGGRFTADSSVPSLEFGGLKVDSVVGSRASPHLTISPSSRPECRGVEGPILLVWRH